MRHYSEMRENVLLEVRCNKCGKLLKVKDGILKEGCLPVRISFDYFSNKDGSTHKWDLCEECYDKIVETFVIPVEEIEEVELL